MEERAEWGGDVAAERVWLVGPIKATRTFGVVCERVFGLIVIS